MITGNWPERIEKSAEMAQMKRLKRVKMNFNFSDDSDADNDTTSHDAKTKHIISELKVKSDSSEELSQHLDKVVDKTIFAGYHLHRTCELPSLSEDLGLPVTESTCIESPDVDPSLYMTALEGDHNQNQLRCNTASKDRNCLTTNDQINHRSSRKQKVIAVKKKHNSEADKENIGFLTAKDKMIIPKLKLQKVSVINNNESLMKTPFKEDEPCEVHTECVNEACFPSRSAEYKKEKINVIPPLFEKLTVVPMEASFIDSVLEQSSHKSFLDSFVEVQDISVQTSLISEDLLMQNNESEYCRTYSNVEDARGPCLPLQVVYSCNKNSDYESAGQTCTSNISLPESNEDSPPSESQFQLNSVKGSEKFACSDVSCRSPDVIQAEAVTSDQSSYEVQDMSVQTSFVEDYISDFRLLCLDDAPQGSSLPCDDDKRQSLQLTEGSSEQANVQNAEKIAVLTSENTENSCSSKEDIGGEMEGLSTELYERACESVKEKTNIFDNIGILSCGDSGGKKGKPHTAQDFQLREGISHENIVSGNLKVIPALVKQSYEFCSDISVSSPVDHGNMYVNSHEASISENKPSTSNASDDETCGILAVASDSEAEEHRSQNNDYVVDKIDESDIDAEEEYGIQYEGENEGKNCHWNRTVDTKCMHQNTRAGKINSEGVTVDSESTAVQEGETSSSSENIFSKKGDSETDKIVREPVNTNRKTWRKNSESSDGDSSFENFMSKVKTSIQTQKPQREEIPLNMFIVENDDEEDVSSAASDEDDDDLLCIETNEELVDEKRYPFRFQAAGYSCYYPDKSSSECTDSDTSDFAVDTSQEKANCKVKSAVPVLDLSHDDSLSKKITPKTPSEWQDKRVDAFETNSDSEEEFKPSKTVASKTPGENTEIPSKKASSFADNGGFSRKEPHNVPVETPFKIPRSFKPGMRSFEVSANPHITEEGFKTPKNHKAFVMPGLQQHPSTAPCPSHVGTRLGDDDDDAFFLKSLTSDIPDYKRHSDAARFVKHFKSTKAELAKRLFQIFNHTIFEDQLPKDFEIEWSPRYRKTAGTFYYKGTPSSFKTKITLSVKICDCPERVRDTLAHELCHAAVRLINGVRESHGAFWKSWARKVNRTFKFMPVIARCHDYYISTKFTYQCVNCKYRIGRHSKSLDTDRKVCGHCRGRFEVYLTSELNSSNESSKTPVVPHTPRIPNKFALFVKECYSEVKKRDVGLKHGDVMKILSQEFAEKNKICD